MKKILSVFLACVLLVGCICTLASCGKSLSGSYEANLIAAEVTYNFKSSGKVIVEVDPIIGDDMSFEGSYEFNEEGDKITISFDAEQEDAEEYAGTMSFSEGEEDGKAYIKLGIIKYNKVD